MTFPELSPRDVADELRCGSRVLLMTRHAERAKIDHDDATFGETLPLTAEGVRTSETFGAELREFAGDVQFLSSPLLRTRMTAESIARGMGAECAPIPVAPELGNDSFYFSDQREVFELFRDGGFFDRVFEYFAAGTQRGFEQIDVATDRLEEWALARFTARLGVFATHDLYSAAFLHARGVQRNFTRENWLRFLDSAAIVLRPDGTRAYALVRAGLSSGCVGLGVRRPNALVLGARSGKFPLEILAREPDLELTVQTYDAHQARKVREDLAAAGKWAEVRCAANLNDGRFWERAFFFDDKLASAEFRLDMLQDLFAHLKSGAKVEGVDAPSRKQALERKRDFSAKFEASVPGGPKLGFVTFPGCFCHRRADEGGLALAEVAAKLNVRVFECSNVRVEPSPFVSNTSPVSNTRTLEHSNTPLRLLDMGCGCGMVGLLVADAMRRAGREVRLTLVDSHARAVAAAAANARALGFDAECVLSDVGLPPSADASFDLFLGNPPYYGGWTIAETFLDVAARALVPGGVCLTVAKSPKGLLPLQERRFASAEIIRRRGYSVLRSVK